MSALRILPREVWEPLARAHEARADAATAGHRSRTARGERHAVEDFLFDYYSLRPGHLRRWHPGSGLALVDAPRHASWPGYTTAGGMTSVDVGGVLATRGKSLRAIQTLLTRTAERPVHVGCFGLHEWAMVYRLGPDDRRHPLPLRLGAQATDDVVESHRIACTHYDAFRFFTPEAVPLNRERLTRELQVDREQPGCLHAGMDLLKWALKLVPLVPGELVLDCFDLAMDARRVDMQASPYDVSTYGLDPIPIETPEGKRQYVDLQRALAERSATLRARLVGVCAAATQATPSRFDVHRPP